MFGGEGGVINTMLTLVIDISLIIPLYQSLLRLVGSCLTQLMSCFVYRPSILRVEAAHLEATNHASKRSPFQGGVVYIYNTSPHGELLLYQTISTISISWCIWNISDNWWLIVQPCICIYIYIHYVVQKYNYTISDHWWLAVCKLYSSDVFAHHQLILTHLWNFRCAFISRACAHPSVQTWKWLKMHALCRKNYVCQSMSIETICFFCLPSLDPIQKNMFHGLLHGLLR